MKNTKFPDSYYPTVEGVLNIIIYMSVKDKQGKTWSGIDTFYYDPTNINFDRNNGKQGSCHLTDSTIEEFIKDRESRFSTITILFDKTKK